MPIQPLGESLRLAELIAALSLATALGSGQPMGHGMRAGVIASRLGEEARLPDDARRDAYYLAMLRYVGCTADAHVVADVLGDEVQASTWFARINQGQPAEAMAAIATHVGAGLPPWQRVMALVHAFAGMPGIYHLGAAHCEVASSVAERLSLPPSLRAALPALMERWDGKGQPGKLRGDAIPVAIRVMNLAQDAAVFLHLGGIEAVLVTLRQRAGRAHDPALVEILCRDGGRLLAGFEQDPSWETAVAAEPGPHRTLSSSELGRACQAIADFVDLKSPYLTGHSRGVARLARLGAAGLGMPEADCQEIELAGLLHDLGRVAVSAAIWQRAGPLSEDDWERVRLHPYYTERILRRPRVLERLGELASYHHERLDGSGYHRRARASHLNPSARLLAAADAYHAMTEPRPHRPALPPDRAAEELRQEARLGRLDASVVNAVLGAAGQPSTAHRRAWPANLTDREVEVLRLVARGLGDKEMAERLGISRKTVSHHVEHLYDKIGVATRPGAALFAMEHDLLRDERLP